jgi:hypothetical protein
LNNTLWDFNSSITSDYYKTYISADDGIIARFDLTKIVGIHEIDNSINSEILIYPNPASELITVELLNFNSNDLTITIFDQLGRTVLSKPHKSVNTSANLNISNFAKGVYFIVVNSDTQVYSSKFIKQ